MQPTQKLLDHALDFVMSLLAKGQSISPHVYVHCVGNLVALPYKDADPGREDLLKQKIIVLIRAARAARILEGVVMVGEGWMSCAKPGQAQVPRPSEDPARVECVHVAAWGSEGRKMAAYRILTSNGKRVVGESVMDWEKLQVRIWIDPAFSQETQPETIQ